MKAKRLSKVQRLDRITTLPQPIIETILCFLPIEETARTSILSREWRYKWTTIPKLVFIQSSLRRSSKGKIPSYFDLKQMTDLERARRKKDIRCELFYAIHQVLLLHRGPIHEFTLEMDAYDTYFEIDQIILHLSRNHIIKKLTLTFYGFGEYGLPSSVFSLPHLTDLYLKSCAINIKPTFNGFGSLTSLSLNGVTISTENLLHLLLNCSSLKSLCLHIFDEHLLRVESPSIMELFKCLPMIEHLTTSGYFIMLLDQATVPKALPTLLFHLKYCAIEDMCFVDGCGLPFLCALIKCSLKLEKIKLEVNTDCCDDIKCVKFTGHSCIEFEEHSAQLEEYSNKLEEYSDVWLEHLNEVEIKYFGNFKPELEFVKLVLARSPSLKKVTLLTYRVNKDEELEMLKILLSASRVSPVKIVVENLSERVYN